MVSAHLLPVLCTSALSHEILIAIVTVDMREVYVLKALLVSLLYLVDAKSTIIPEGGLAGIALELEIVHLAAVGAERPRSQLLIMRRTSY